MTGVKAIADALSVSSSMTSLDIAGNSIGGYDTHPGYTDNKFISDMTGVKAIAEALSVSSSMNSLK